MNAGTTPDDPFAAQQALNAFTMGHRVAADDLIEQLQVDYPPPAQETSIQPGDVVLSEDTGRVWWVHGHAGLSLSVTDLRGYCLPAPEAVAVHGRMRVLYSHLGQGPAAPPAPPR